MLIDDLLAKHKATLPSEFIVTIEAQNFLDAMHAQYPGELAEWTHAHALDVVTNNLWCMLFGDRQKARGRRGRFRDATDQFDPADAESVDVFSQRFVIDHDNMWRRLGEMTGKDHLFVADQYTKTGRRALMEAAFHRAIAKRVGDRRTDEVFGPDELTELRVTFVSRTDEAG